ncbi:MAG: PilZ domain-containing protein [Polyangia bacterium]
MVGPADGTIPFEHFDLSPVGVYLYSDLLLCEGEKVELRLSLPCSSDPVTVDGVVVRAQVGDEQQPPGMGVVFRDTDKDALAALRRYVAGRFAGNV